MTIQVMSPKIDKPHAYRFNETDNWLMFDPYEISRSDDGQTWHSYYDDTEMSDIYCYGVDIGKANPVDTLRTFQGTDGQTIDSTRYETRAITAHFVAKTTDLLDSELVAMVVQRFFASRAAYWVAFGGSFGEPFKRWLVKAGQVSVVSESESWILVDVPLTNLNGYARSIVNSVEFATNIGGYGGFGMNLPSSGLSYSSSASSFNIYNPSDIKVDPLRQHHDMTITFTGTGTPTIKNTTNNTEFAFTKALTSGDKLELIRVNPYLNGTQSGVNSDHGWIELEPGNNAITMSGFSGTVQFDFPFYFL